MQRHGETTLSSWHCKFCSANGVASTPLAARSVLRGHVSHRHVDRNLLGNIGTIKPSTKGTER